MKPKIYILLPVHNRHAITKKFIECLVAQSYMNYHLILIDDGSTDGTSEIVRAKISNLTVLRGEGDWWWAGSLQQGISWLKQHEVDDNDLVVFMNDDVIFDKEFLQTAVKIMDRHDGLLHPQVFNRKTRQVEESGVFADFKNLKFINAITASEINCLPTRGLFMKMAVLRKVGGFYPKFLPHYLSDYEFTIRAHRLGLKLVTSPRLLISFDEKATGYRHLEGLSFPLLLKRLFSIKCPHNPVYWTAFILLASPRLLVPLNLARIWFVAAKTILRSLMPSQKV